MFKNKILYKITAGYVLIVLIALSIIGTVFITMFRDNTFKAKESSMQTSAKNIAKVVEPYLSNNADINGYNNFMELLDSFSNSRIWISDINGNIVAMSNGEFCMDEDINVCDLSLADKAFVKKALNGETIIEEGFSNFYNEFMLAVGVPVFDDKGKIIGTVFMHSPVVGITNAIDKAFLFLIVAIFMALLLTCVLGIFYSSFITKPIKAMNNVAMEMARGNYDVKTNIRQNDEIGQLGNSLDILASKLGYTVDQLFQERNKLKDLVTSISEGILAFDENMQLINFNQAFINLFQYDRNGNIEQQIKIDLNENGILQEFEAVIESGKGNIIIVEYNIMKLKFTLSAVKNNIDEIIGVVALIQDISASERLEQTRRDFVTNVSHEFRTPLTIVQGSVEALIDGTVTDGVEVNKYYGRILKEAKGLERLVRDLLDLGKLQSGKLNFQFENIDVIQLITDVSKSLQTVADKKNIAIEYSYTNGVPSIIGDYDRLRQLLIIFLDNAIKYSKENTKIKVSVRVSDYVYVKITDSGIGISKEDLPYIWDRFYKVDKSRSQSHLGTGLGLSIAKYLIEAHNGTVRFESKVNSGTTVEIGLPFNK